MQESNLFVVILKSKWSLHARCSCHAIRQYIGICYNSKRHHKALSWITVLKYNASSILTHSNISRTKESKCKTISSVTKLVIKNENETVGSACNLSNRFCFQYILCMYFVVNCCTDANFVKIETEFLRPHEVGCS